MAATVVTLTGVDGTVFTLAGANEGDKGVYLATGLTGIFEPPVKAVYEEPGNYPGARYLTHRVLRRDIVLGVWILHDTGGGNSWLSRDAGWRKAWAFDKDCTLAVTTDESGTRKLKVRLAESPEITTETDPRGNTVNLAKMVLVALDPFWYSDDAVYTATTTTNTTFNPLSNVFPWQKSLLPNENLSITVPVCNPTDQYIFPVWTVPGSAQAPGAPYVPGIPWLGMNLSPTVIWTIPDYSFEDSTYANRRVQLPGLIGGLRTNEVQCFDIGGILTGGTFTLTLGAETTPAIPYNGTVGQVKAALEATAAIAFDDVLVERGKKVDEVQIVNVSGGPTGGSFTLKMSDGTTTGTTASIPYNATAIEMYTAINNMVAPWFLSNVTVTAKTTNSIQEVLVTGEPTGGTWTLTFDGETTAPLNYNANALAVYQALANTTKFSTIPASITVTKKIFEAHSPYVITFNGSRYAGIDVQPFTGDGTNLTGGAGADIAVTQKQKGSKPYVVTFKHQYSARNIPEMAINTNSLTGGVSPTTTVTTKVQGSYPYIVTFRNNVSGTNFAPLVVNTGGLTGVYKNSTVWKNVEGYTAPAENCVIDTDPKNEQVVSESGSTIWGRMNGVRFRYPIPPWTGSKTFQISVSGAPAGQMVSLRLKRPWSRPWGLE